MGRPIAGVLIQAGNKNYLEAQIWAAVSMLLGAATLMLARVGQTGRDLPVEP